MAGWHHRLDEREFEWTPGDGNGQRAWRAARFMGLQRVRHDWVTEMNWTELNWTDGYFTFNILKNLHTDFSIRVMLILQNEFGVFLLLQILEEFEKYWH